MNKGQIDYNLIGEEFFDIMAVNSVDAITAAGNLQSALVLLASENISSTILYDKSGNKHIVSSKLAPMYGDSIGYLSPVELDFVAEGTTVVNKTSGQLIIYRGVDEYGNAIWNDTNGNQVSLSSGGAS